MRATLKISLWAGRRWPAFALALFLTPVAGCSRPQAAAPAAPDPAPAPSAALALPDVAGFTAGPPEPGQGFVRRAYVRAPARVQVTLARTPMSADDYQRWQSASDQTGTLGGFLGPPATTPLGKAQLRQRVGFPQADLGLPAADANGFYQCGDSGPKPSCDLLIQLRSGFHLELRGGGTTARADVDALARGLPLRSWSVHD